LTNLAPVSLRVGPLYSTAFTGDAHDCGLGSNHELTCMPVDVF